jgi:hypothetical protein
MVYCYRNIVGLSPVFGEWVNPFVILGDKVAPLEDAQLGTVWELRRIYLNNLFNLNLLSDNNFDLFLDLDGDNLFNLYHLRRCCLLHLTGNGQ